MPVKRPSKEPAQGQRKRPRVPKFDEGNDEQENQNQPIRRADDDEEEDDVQADYMEERGTYVEDIYIPPKLTLTERPTRGERLIIDKITCENFKSYGGIKVMGPLHKSFSAIGPNGNGKSNIIDAMLFAFGYRAKKIRCKKVSALIHKSELLPHVNCCAVTVHFVKIIDNGEDDQTELNIVPNSEISVCRRAYQNNSSAYWLNGRKVLFNEVASFLKQNGIDIVHNRFLILQGEVEQIAQMPPKATNAHETGFLEFIDEVIGTKRYEKPLEKLRTRMGELEFQREDKSQRVTLAEQHKTGLIEPMKKATAFLRDRNTRDRVNHELHQVKAYKCRKFTEGHAEKLKELEQTQTRIMERLVEIKKYNDERGHEYSQAEKAYQVVEAKFQENKKAMNDADQKYGQLNQELKASNEERKKKKDEKEKTAKDLEKLHGLPESNAKEIEKLEKRRAELEESIKAEEEATKESVKKLMEQVDKCVAEKRKADGVFRGLKATVDETRAARDTMQKELDRWKANEVAEKEKLEKLQKDMDTLARNVEAAQIEYQEVMEQKKKFEEDASAIETEIEELKWKVMHYLSDLETNRRMLPMKAEMVKEQEAKVKQTTMSERTLQERQKRIDEANAALEKAREPYEEAEEKVNALADQVKFLQTEKKKEILKKLDKFKDQHKRVEEEMKKLNVELRNCEKNKQKLESKIEKLAKEVETIQTKMLAMIEEKKSLEEVASSLKEEEAVLQEDKDAKFKVHNELKTKSSEFDQEEKKLNKEKVSVDNNFQSISAEVKDYERQERQYKASLQNFKLTEIPEVEVEPLQMLSDEELERSSVKELETKLAKHNQKLKREEPNLNKIDDYNQACHTLLKRVQELEEVNTRRELIKNACLTLEAQRMKEFMEGYAMISAKVKELFRMFSMGGDAELDLLDSTDPFSSGIDFSVRPMGKTWEKIINLSGGEKTLSSLALVFSLHHFKPSPFYVMDEIDTALDFHGLRTIANYIKERTKFTQFILVSQRSNMFQLADSLLGVCKVDRT